MPLDHLRLQEMSDRELLLRLQDVADADGYASAEDIGEALGIEPEHRVRVITSRLTWLKRWGAVDREPLDEVERIPGGVRRLRMWKLSPIGHQMATGQLRKAQQEAIQNARDGDVLELTAMLAHVQRTGPLTVRNLMRREWTYRTRYSSNGG